MGIKGDVRSLSLANVLQDLAMNEQTGTLHIRAKERQVGLWFERGALRLVGLGPGEGPSLLNGLLALGKIEPAELPEAHGRRTSEANFLRTLAKKGRVSRDDLKAALEHQMAEHLCDAFLWPEATFEFEEGEPDDRHCEAGQLDLEPRLAVDAVIVEAMRRADEWGETRKAILSSREILVPDLHRVPAEVDPITRRILDLLDGERTLGELQDLTRLGQFTVHRVAAQLLRSGAARPLSAQDALERARGRADRKEWEAALRMARYGLDHERTNLAHLELALRCCEQLEDAAGAAGYARQLASAQADSGQLEPAIATYQKVIALAPRDLTAHERLFSILLDLDLKLDALAAGETYAAACKKAGLPDKAAEVYQRLVDKLGDQPDLLESLAEVQRHLGDKKEAAALYRKLLARALEAKDDAGALDYCRTIVKLDPQNEEALQLRQRLESGQVEIARKRRRRMKGATALGIVVALVAVAGNYEMRARSTLADLEPQIQDATLEKKYGTILGLYDQVGLEYSWSFAAREVRPRRDHIEKLYVEEELKKVSALELPEAMEALEETLLHARLDENRARLTTEIEKLRKRRTSGEDGWRRRLADADSKEIDEVRGDPLAVPALETLLVRNEPATRLATVKALGGVQGRGATTALIRALGDVDPRVCSEAAEWLKRRTGQDFGTDRLKWDRWWADAGRRAGRPPLQAIIVSPSQKLGPKDPAAVAWQISNFSAGEVSFVLEESPRLQMTGPSGPIPLPAAEMRGRRSFRLGPGEFVGGTFGVGEATRAPGTYRLTWSAPVTWSGKKSSVEAAPLTLERAP